MANSDTLLQAPDHLTILAASTTEADVWERLTLD